ncbi:hypothetical protein EPA93_30305 [Ktedonosporobacter rubrisoli]|uniref:Uncharacterized protein n=1 Tax=Ktedonosporobacter rubrisoli TaxID=2509675 RepID=A0A4P6JX17_KTERU|nr:DUF6585 family protein [Ktedonosporobacter rubrisoli]QBD80045.1 hypothetical protein EPA93_30305 [Ktedonosporobacter rubrisoli]
MQSDQTSLGVPTEIEQMARKHTMGSVRNIFGSNTYLAHARRRGGFVMLGTALVFCLIGIACMAGGAAGWVFIIIALIPLGLSPLFFSWASRLEKSAIRLYLYKDGFIYYGRDHTAQPFRWDQITAVWRHVIRLYRNGSYIRTMYLFIIQRKDGLKIELNDDLGAIEIVGDTISEQTTRILLPPAMEQVMKGQTISFGPLSLKRQELSKGGQVLPCQQIEAVDLHEGFVRVKRWGKWSNLEEMRKVPNVMVFLNLAETFLKQEKDRGTSIS